MTNMTSDKQLLKVFRTNRKNLTKREGKVYLDLLNKATDSRAMQNFLDFLLSKYDDAEKVTLTVAWKIEGS